MNLFQMLQALLSELIAAPMLHIQPPFAQQRNVPHAISNSIPKVSG